VRSFVGITDEDVEDERNSEETISKEDFELELDMKDVVDCIEH